MVQVCVMHVHRRVTHMAIDNIFVYFLFPLTSLFTSLDSWSIY